MAKYKVLWLEDEQEKMDAFFDLASNVDIELILVETFKELKEKVLTESKNFFDAIILDAFGLIESKSEKTSLRALNLAIQFITEHKSKDLIPYFVLSAYLGEDDNKSVRDLLGSEKIYIKTNDEKKLLSDILESIPRKVENQLKFKYQSVFEACGENYLDQEKRIFKLLRYVESNDIHDEVDDPEDNLTTLRKIIESLFYKLGKLEIIPSEITTNKGWINGSRNFLSNNHSIFNFKNSLIHPLVLNNLCQLVNILNDVSHAEGDLKLKVDEYLQAQKNDYLYRSYIYLLLDTLNWFKRFMDDNNDINKNKCLWEVVNQDWVVGVVTKIANNGFGTFQPESSDKIISILPNMVEEYKLSESVKIKVILKPNSDGTKLYIKTISKEL